MKSSAAVHFPGCHGRGGGRVRRGGGRVRPIARGDFEHLGLQYFIIELQGICRVCATIWMWVFTTILFFQNREFWTQRKRRRVESDSESCGYQCDLAEYVMPCHPAGHGAVSAHFLYSYLVRRTGTLAPAHPARGERRARHGTRMQDSSPRSLATECWNPMRESIDRVARFPPIRHGCWALPAHRVHKKGCTFLP